MKAHIIKTGLFVLLLLMMGVGCEEDDNSQNYNYVNGYIVGSFICDEVSCGTQFQRGYCILLETNKNDLMDFYTFNLPTDIFAFPDNILKHHDNNNCGPAFFPDNLIKTYKIRFQYLITKESRKPTYGCYAMEIPFPWDNYYEVSMRDVIKY